MKRPLLELSRYLHALGHVSGVDHHAGHRRVAQQIGGHDLHVAPTACGVGDPGFEGRRHTRSGHNLSGSFGQFANVVRVYEFAHRHALHLVGLPAQDAGHSRAGVQDPSVLADDAHQVRGVLHESGQAHLGGLHPLLGGVEVSQVAGHHRDGVHYAFGVAVGHQHGRHRDRRTIANQAQLTPPRPSAAHGGQGGGGVLGLRPAVQQVQQPRGSRASPAADVVLHGVVGPHDQLARRVQNGHWVGAGFQHPRQLVGSSGFVDLVGDVGNGQQRAARTTWAGQRHCG